MKQIYFTSVFCCFLFLVNAQKPGVRWSKYIGSQNDGQFIFDGKQTNDKGFILIGTDTSWINAFNEEDFLNKDVKWPNKNIESRRFGKFNLGANTA